jgi:hypothetical protein
VVAAAKKCSVAENKLAYASATLNTAINQTEQWTINELES